MLVERLLCVTVCVRVCCLHARLWLAGCPLAWLAGTVHHSNSSWSSNELRAIVLARGAPALLKPRFRERGDAGLKLNLICRAMGGGEWEGWLAKLPSHLAPISPPPFFSSHFLPPNRTVNSSRRWEVPMPVSFQPTLSRLQRSDAIGAESEFY